MIEFKRKLASVQEIKFVEPIEGADRIVKVGVLGWQCVTQKSNGFKPGDKVVYHEIDSLLPLGGVYEFLRKKPEETHARLKTIRLRGVISQGLVLPLDIVVAEIKHLHKEKFNEDFDVPTDIGTDYTEFLSIKKYEPPIDPTLRGSIKGVFPSFIEKTDEERVQNLPDSFFASFPEEPVVVTEKLDGTSFTCYWYPLDCGLPYQQDDAERGYAFGVCSRNMNLKFDAENLYWKIALKYDLENKLKAIGKPIAIQGEIVGPGINGNRLNVAEHRLYGFTIQDIVKHRRYGHDEAVAFFKQIGVECVPQIEIRKLGNSINEWLEISKRKSVINPDVWAEGVVVRGLVDRTDIQNLTHFSFKVINPEWLLKYE